jgi:hypothetical protein
LALAWRVDEVRGSKGVRGWVWAGLAASWFAGAGGPVRPPAPAPERPVAPPRLAVEPAGRIDLGELGPLEHAEQPYRIRNVSGAAIALRVLDLSPGVRVSGAALEGPIAPGAAAALVLRVDPSGWVGPQNRNVRLGTDDPRQGDYYLPVRMRVRPDLSVDATRLSFGDMPAEARPEVAFRFARETGEPLRLRVTGPLPDYLECQVEASGPVCRLLCRFHPERVPPGMRLGLERVPVETNAPLQPHVDLVLDWRLHYPVEAVPSRLVFQEASPDTRELRLQARGGTAFRILAADLEGAGFRLEEVPRAEAPEQRLRVRRVAEQAARATLVLRFSGMEEALRVPLAYLPSQVPEGEGNGTPSVPHP